MTTKQMESKLKELEKRVELLKRINDLEKRVKRLEEQGDTIPSIDMWIMGADSTHPLYIETSPVIFN